MAAIEIDQLTKRFGALTALDDISLMVEHGLLVSLLGPSGCGKTTALRLVAGFLNPDEGAIRVGSRVLSAPGTVVPPERRNMSMIFPSYALWPHMTIAENIAYGLKLRRLPRTEIERRVGAMLGVTRLAHSVIIYDLNESGDLGAISVLGIALLVMTFIVVGIANSLPGGTRRP